MQSLRQLRQRIRSVQNTRKLTKAMQMVAAAKLRRFESAVVSGRPYAEGVRALLNRLASSKAELTHPLFQRGNAGRKLLLVVSSDTGLCGAYNSHLFRAVERFLDDRLEERFALALIGKKARAYFRRRPFPVAQSWQGLRGGDGVAEIEPIARWLIQAFTVAVERGATDGRPATVGQARDTTSVGPVDEVWIAATQFRSIASFSPVIRQWLPVEVSAGTGAASAPVDYLIEPSAQQVLDALVEPCLLGELYMVLLGAFASEQAARMMAMKSATDNADEVGQQLTLLRNKIRQASITKEILEVVGGAEALK